MEYAFCGIENVHDDNTEKIYIGLRSYTNSGITMCAVDENGTVLDKLISINNGKVRRHDGIGSDIASAIGLHLNLYGQVSYQ